MFLLQETLLQLFKINSALYCKSFTFLKNQTEFIVILTYICIYIRIK